MIYEVREDVTFARRSSSSALERNHLSAEIRIPRCDSPRERSFVLSFLLPFPSLLGRETRAKGGPMTIRPRRGRIFAESELDSPHGESIYRGSDVSCLGADSSRRGRILVFSRTRRYHCAQLRQRASTSRNYRRLSRFFPRARLSHGTECKEKRERERERERERARDIQRERKGKGEEQERRRDFGSTTAETVFTLITEEAR